MKTAFYAALFILAFAGCRKEGNKQLIKICRYQSL